MAATSTLTLRVKTIGERSIDGVTRKLMKLQAVAHSYNAVSQKSFEATNVKWKKHMDAVDKGIQMVGKGLVKFVTFSAKFAAVQLGVLGAAMMGVHAAFVVGNAAMKAFRWLATGAAGAAAALTIAASTAAAAIREQQIAMYSYKGGQNYQNASVMMRQLASDADMAAVGAENLNAVFAEVSKSSTFTAGSSNLLKGLMDFASAGKPLEDGAKAAGKLIAAIQDPKGSFSKMKEAAKELGPEMEKAITDLGITTGDQLKKAILDGTLSAAGGVDGQFKRVNETLLNRFKATFALIKADFADFGDPMLAPVKNLLEDISRIFKRTFDRVAGDIAGFANAGFFGEVGGIVDKIGDFFVNFIRDYLPKVNGMFESLGDWWGRFKDGWNMILDKARPLIDGAKILEETLMRVLRPIGQSLSEGFGDFNQQLQDNKEEFFAFGDSIGRFIAVISKYAKTVREIFIDALPFITKIVDGMTGLVDVFMSFLGGLRGLLGGGGLGSFMLLASLLTGGRGLKKNPGGVVFAGNLKDVTPGRGGGPLTGQTPDGNVTEGARDRAKRLAQVAGKIQNQSVVRMNVANMTVMSQSDKATATARSQQQQQKRDAQRYERQYKLAAAKAIASQQKLEATGTSMRSAGGSAAAVAAQTRLEAAKAKYDSSASGMSRWRAGREYRRAAKANFEANRGTITLPQAYGAPDATYKNTWWTRNVRMPASMKAEMDAQMRAERAAAGVPMGPMTTMRSGMQKFRQARESTLYKRMFGGNIGTEKDPRMVKGINNSMMAGMGASVGLGLLSNIMPQESQGALALGSTVAMFNPLAGLAVGVVGGLIMGFRGAAAKRKKEAINAAKNMAEEFTKDSVEGFRKGMKDALETGTASKEKTESMRQKALAGYRERLNELDSLIMGTLNARGRRSLALGSGNAKYGPGGMEIGASTAKELARLDLEGYDIMDSGDLKDIAEKQKMLGIGMFGKMTDEQYKAATGNIDAFVAAQREAIEVQGTAFELVTQFGTERASSIGRTLGKTDVEVQKLADSIGLNLFDSTQTTTEQIKLLAEAMISTSKELFNAAQDRYAQGTDIFRRKREAVEGRQALNEGAFAIRGILNEGMSMSPEDLTIKMMDYLENTRQQMIAYYKGDVMLAEQQFFKTFGAGGTAYTTEGGPLQGMEKVMMDLAGEEIALGTRQYQEGATASTQELINSRLMAAGFEATGDIGQFARMAAMDPTYLSNFNSLLEGADLTNGGDRAAIESEMERFLKQNDPTKTFDIQLQRYVEPQLEAADAMKTAAETFKESTMTFQDASQMIIDELGGNKDTRMPRGAIGDSLSSNLANTMANHSAISSSLSGSRQVTSSYRNYALGSLKSDHITGRALDIVGDSLVSYKDKMTQSGGFAQFHGRGKGRHLHVVPPRGSIGDSLTAVSATSSTVSSGGDGTNIMNTNNFYITGQNANEIADVVMLKMAQVTKSNEERR